MAGLLSWLGQEAGNVGRAIGVVPNDQGAQKSIQNANQQLQNAHSGVLANPQTQQRFQQYQQTNSQAPFLANPKFGKLAQQQNQVPFYNNTAPSQFNAPRAVGGAVWNTAKNIPASIINTAQVPYDVARLGVANVAQDQAAINGAHQAMAQDTGNNLFSPDVPFLKSVAATGLNPVSNHYMNQEANRAQSELGKSYTTNPQTGQPMQIFPKGAADLEASRVKQQFLQDQLNRAGLNQNDSTARTILKVGGQAGSLAANTIMQAQMGNALAERAGLGNLNNQFNGTYTVPTAPVPKTLSTNKYFNAAAPYAKQAASNGGLNAATNILGTAQQDNQKAGDFLMSGVKGFGTGAAMSLGSDVAGVALGKTITGLEKTGNAVHDVATNTVSSIKRPYPLNDKQLNSIINYRNQMGTMNLKNGTYQEAKAALNRVGVQHTDTQAIDNLIGKFQTFDSRRAALQSSLALNEGGYIKNPLYKDQSQASSSKQSLAPGNKERGFTTGVKQSPEFSAKLQEKVNSEYTPFTNKAATQETAKFMKQSLKTAKDQVIESLSQGQGVHVKGSAGNMHVEFGKQEVANAGAVIKALDQKGDINGAQQIHDLLAAKLTNAGQTSQAASLIYNRTPEGLKNMAIRDLTKAKVPITEQLKSQLDAAYKAISQAKPGTREDMLARAKLVKLVGKQIPTGAWDKAISLYKTGILSAPSTAVKVAMVNPITTALETAKDFPAAAVDRGVSLFTGKRSMVAPDMRNLGAAAKALPTAARDMKLRFADNIVMPGSSGLGMRELSSASLAHPDGANFGVKSGGQRTLLDRATGGVSSKVLNGYTSSIGRVHGAIQTPMYEARAAQSLMQSAEAEAINQGLRGPAKNDFIQKFLKNPPKAAQEQSQLDAQYATSQQKTALGQAAGGLQRTMPGGQIIAPITRIPGAVATQVINYSPFGAVKTAAQAIGDAARGKDFNQRQFSQGLGRAIVGTGLMAGGAALMANGRMSGDYPHDKATQNLWQAANIPANSVYVGGHAYPNEPWKNTGGKWLQVGSPGGPAAQVALTGGQAYKGFKDGGVPGAVQEGASGGARIVTEQPYLTGISGAMNLVNNPGASSSFYDQMAGSVVPNFVRSYAAATDPLQRQTAVSNPISSMKNAVTNGIPGLREKNLPQVDLYGNQLKRNDSAAGTYLDPLKPQTTANNPVTDVLGGLHNQTDVNGKPLSIPTQLPKKYTYAGPSGQKQTLSDAQRTQFVQTTGQQAQQEVAKLIQTPVFKQATPDQQSTMIMDKFSGARNIAATQLPNSNVKLSSAGKAVDQGRNPTINPITGKVTTAQTVAGLQKTDPKAAYTQAQAKYDQAVKAGTLSPAQQYTQQQTLNRMKVQSDYPAKVVDLYGLSNTQLHNYLQSTPIDQATADKLQQLDSAMADAGYSQKYKNGVGVVSVKTASSVKGTSTRRSTGGTAKVAKVKTLRLKTIKQPTMKTAFKTGRVKVSRPKMPSFAVKTPKVTKRTVA